MTAKPLLAGSFARQLPVRANVAKSLLINEVLQ